MLISEELDAVSDKGDEFDLGLAPGYCRRLKFTEENAPVIVDYLKSLAKEINVSDNYKRMNLTTLVYFSRYRKNNWWIKRRFISRFGI